MKKDTVLIVDDFETNRLILEDILSDLYDIAQAENGVEAVSMMFSGTVIPSVVLLDIMMPEMDGFEVLELMKSNNLTANIPVLFITAADAESSESKGLSLGAIDYISKPFNPKIVRNRVINHVKLRNYSVSLEEMVREKVDELVHAKDRLLEALADVIEYRNCESGQHVKRTKDFTKIIIDYMVENPNGSRYIPEADISIIIKAVSLHDIGKIGIPDNVLLKPGPLTKEEYEIIKKHPVIGSEIIKDLLDIDKDNQYMQYCYDIARHHHEYWNGLGYPDGIGGEDIPLAARILAVVDVYDALVSQRVYKPQIGHDSAVEIIKAGSGTQFDPEIVDIFLKVCGQFKNFNQRNRS